MTVLHSYAASARLLPIKFLLLLTQTILVVIVILEEENHIYFDVGENYSENSTVYKDAVVELEGVSGTMIGLCGLEFLMMIVGTSAVPSFAKYNLLQIILHLLGCLFTLWFILDSWRYDRIWALFVLFSLLPIGVEINIIWQSYILNKGIRKARRGELKLVK